MSGESLSVEETNALRTQMGLPPLKPTQPPTTSAPPPQPPNTDDDNTTTLTHLRSELTRRKQARLASQLLSAPSLSEQLSFQTGGAAAAWVERSRRVMEEERAAAAVRSRAEAERLRLQREEAGRYGAAHLRGLRVAHQYDDFDADEGQATVLVLKDKVIGAADDDEDELVNHSLSEQARRQQLSRDNQQRKGRAWDEDADGGGPRLLGKYDEEKEQEGIVLGGGGVYGREEDVARRRKKEAEEREERLREGWNGAAVVTQEYDMSSTTERKIDSDYKPVKFKRKVKSEAKPDKPLRSTASAPANEWINQLEQQALSSSAHSSGQQQTTAAQVEDERKEKRVAGYLRAIERGGEETRRRLERDREEADGEAERRRRAAMQREVEDEDEELAAALAKARRVTAKEREAPLVRVKVEGEEDGAPVSVGRDSEVKRMAERIRSERDAAEGSLKSELKPELSAASRGGEDDGMQGIEQDDGSIVFTSVSNFASGLQGVDEEDRVKREKLSGVHEADEKSEEKADAAMVDDKKPVKVKKESARQQRQQEEGERSGWIRHDEEGEPMDDGKEEKNGEKSEDEDEEEEDEEEDDEDDGLLGDEPLASEGIAATLALAKRRAYLASTDSSASAPTTFTLTKYDALGRELSAKEQFRSLSHAFHGQGAGWNKKDKRNRALRREVGVMRKRADKGLEEGSEKVLEAQKRLGQPFIVLESNKSTHGGFGGGGGGGAGGRGTDSVAGAGGHKRVKR